MIITCEMLLTAGVFRTITVHHDPGVGSHIVDLRWNQEFTDDWATEDGRKPSTQRPNEFEPTLDKLLITYAEQQLQQGFLFSPRAYDPTLHTGKTNGYSASSWSVLGATGVAGPTGAVGLSDDPGPVGSSDCASVDDPTLPMCLLTRIALAILCDRWPAGEEALLRCGSVYDCVGYAVHVMETRWPDLEEKILHTVLERAAHDMTAEQPLGAASGPTSDPLDHHEVQLLLYYRDRLMAGCWPELDTLLIIAAL